MVFKNLCILIINVLWTKVASAFEGLRRTILEYVQQILGNHLQDDLNDGLQINEMYFASGIQQGNGGFL